eukprot:TRINITY_DN111518_c0_g1_i1.p1 TRINITY_DN111518_c0_g1~~TRINITY_DN111518_c0_g1_i1.p1  ORF type:complete len:625 (+),score=42.12 TRINITY_DN111518_c0_g1_i1:49-1923(+)
MHIILMRASLRVGTSVVFVVIDVGVVTCIVCAKADGICGSMVDMLHGVLPGGEQQEVSGSSSGGYAETLGKRRSSPRYTLQTEDLLSIIDRYSCQSFWQPEEDLQALPSHVDRELLRAAPLTEVLGNFGKHFESKAGSVNDFNMSECVDHIDDFLSHDWGTPRWQKMLCLSLFYNGRAACCASCAIAVPVALLGSSVQAFRGHAAALFCPMIYLIVLLFGQRLRSLFRRPTSVFLDKLCIHQADEDKKADGILGLAGFLRSSKRLVLIWSPRYFSRLWCTYELVSWCHLHGLEPSRVCFLPVASCIVQFQAVAVFTASVFIQAVFGILQYPVGGAERFDLLQRGTLLLLASAGTGLSVMPLVLHLRLLHLQVQNFSIRDSHSFCCTHNHEHPDSGRRIPCDRKLVYSTLHTWYLRASQIASQSPEIIGPAELRPCTTGDLEAEEWAEGLDRFDQAVRSGLSCMLARAMNNALMCVSYRDCLCAAVPAVWAGIDYTTLLCSDGRPLEAARWMFEYAAITLFVFPLCIVATLKGTRVMERLTYGFSSTSLRRCLCVLVATSTFFLSSLLMLAPGVVVTDLNKNKFPGVRDLPLALRFTSAALLTRYFLGTPKVYKKLLGATRVHGF